MMTSEPERFVSISLAFSAGQWEGEALQAEKTGKWFLLCVKDQSLRNTEGVDPTLFQTGRWPLCASGWTVQKGTTYSTSNNFICFNSPSHRSDLNSDLIALCVSVAGGSTDSRSVLQHSGPMGDWSQLNQAAAEAGSRSVWWGLRGPVEWHNSSRSEDPQTRYTAHTTSLCYLL